MSSQLLSFGQVKTVRKNGEVEFATHGASIRPERYQFANQQELNKYLAQAVGGKLEGDGIRGTISRKGRYTRHSSNGSPVVTFGDPVLDAVSSPTGSIVIGDRTIDLRQAEASMAASASPSGGTVVFADSGLKFTGIVNGAERWATDDMSYVEYRLGSGVMSFHAWKKDTFYLYWSMGGEISIVGTDTKFDAAHIVAPAFMSVPGQPPCAVYEQDPESSTLNSDDYLDHYVWGWNSQQPERVAVLCRAQWHHARFRDILIAGSGCPNYQNYSFPFGFPAEWDTPETFPNLNGNWSDGSSNSAVISVHFKSLSVDMSAFQRPGAHGSILGSSQISVTFPDDRTYTGNLQVPNKIFWSNGSVWQKIINTSFDLNGVWTDGTRKAVISEGPHDIKIDMSDYDRPQAHGSIVNNTSIQITFPDEATHTATLQAPNTIHWSNGSAWTRTHYLYT